MSTILKAVPLMKQKKSTSTGEQSGRVCIVHYTRCKRRLMKPLSEKAFNSIQAAKAIRCRSTNSLHQLLDICQSIPDTYDGERHGMHVFCFKSFTNTANVKAALSLLDTSAETSVARTPPKTRKRMSTGESVVASSKVNLYPKNLCLFCNKGPTKKRGRYVGLTKCETPDAEKLIENCAKKRDDFDIIGKFTVKPLLAYEAHYHENCRKNYVINENRHRSQSTAADETTDEFYLCGGVEHRKAYDEAFQAICAYITEHIINGGSVVRMTTLRELYLNYIQEHSPEFHNPDHRTQKLKEKIVRHFGDRVKFWQPNTKSDLIYSAGVSTGDAVAAAFESATSESQLLEDAAMVLRRYILEQQRTSPDMPWPPSATFLKSSAVCPPPCLLHFLSTLMTGKPSAVPNERVSRVSLSVAEDLCAASTNGQWKMPKHFLLGMALRHFTGSAKVMTMVNKFGHCSSYAQLMELENAMAIQIQSRDSILPYNISVDGNKFIHACFDNFDLREETLSGSNTTHSTHGILIQEMQPDSTPTVIETTLPKTKQKLKYVPEILPPVFCPRQVEPVLNSPSSSSSSESITCALQLTENAWTICRASCNSDCTVPEWSGWLSLTAQMAAAVQQSVVGYLAPIMNPITEDETVHKCLLMSMEAAAKVKQKYSFVTMDLAAAKIAYKIQWQYPDKFASVIIHLGGFHTMCSYMGALGKMMCNSGFEDIIIEAGVCASGSIEKVMTGKHYNRAMRAHQLMLDATERLLLQAFIQVRSCSLPIEDELKSLASNPTHDALSSVVDKIEFAHFVSDYNSFRSDVRAGKFGNTAQFWMIYIDSVWHLLRFQRAIKENDFDLYLDSMRSMCGLLFAADHLNYARYLPLYNMQLRNLSTTHPGAVELLRSNGFSVSRSSVPACRNAIDITIEQTINRSAKTSGGIIGFSRNAPAYYRWTLTRVSRAEFAQTALSRVDMASDVVDTHKSIRPTELKNSESCVQKLLDTIKQFMDPFGIDLGDKKALYCLSSGQPASEKVTEDLLRYADHGNKVAEDFIKERLVDKSVNFHDTMKRQNLATFKAMAVKKAYTTKQNKTVEIKAERNLLGRLLFLSQTHNISLLKMFSYPMGPIPWSLATADGCMVKSNKAQLLHHLETLVDTCITPSLHDSVYIIDGNALLQSCVQLPETFEEFASQIFSYLPKSSTVHFVTDSYNKNSIKQFERNRRGLSEVRNIGGPKTKMPRDFKAFMHNSKNKQQLIRFILEEWRSDKYARRLHERTVFFVREEECFCLHSTDGQHVTSTLITSLCSEQEEADTRVIIHSLYADVNTLNTSAIIIRSPDTDILIILISYASSIKQQLFLDTGTGNKRRMIDVKAIATSIGEDMSTILPAYHAFTGCDYTSSFVRRGKVKPFKILQKETDLIVAFRGLGMSLNVDEEVLRGLEHFVCCMYGQPRCHDVNQLRHDLFQSRYGVKTESKAFTKPDGVDLSMLPPCRSSLKLHVMRVNYVTNIWRNAHVAYPKIPAPDGFGWELTADGSIAVQWTHDKVLPKKLSDVLSGTESTDYCDEELANVEEDYEVENILDVIFSDGEDD